MPNKGWAKVPNPTRISRLSSYLFLTNHIIVHSDLPKKKKKSELFYLWQKGNPIKRMVNHNISFFN
jgi:hypothetical protein